jgi:hypothetical protein
VVIPIPVLITRPDIVFVNAAGQVFNNAGAGLTPVVNVPGGGASRSTRRPDVVPGVDPFIKDGGLIFLNPAAFATPAPGAFGNLERNSIHGPWFRQVDLVVSKRIPMGQGRNLELRSEFFNIFNIANFANPVGTLPNALPNASLGEANRCSRGSRLPVVRPGHSVATPARSAARSASARRARSSLQCGISSESIAGRVSRPAQRFRFAKTRDVERLFQRRALDPPFSFPAGLQTRRHNPSYRATKLPGY